MGKGGERVIMMERPLCVGMASEFAARN